MTFRLRIERYGNIMRKPPQPRGSKCGCDCDGCNATGYGRHCLTAPCTLTRNRRSKAIRDAERRSAPPRVRVPAKPRPAVREPKPEPKPVESIKQDPYRSEWFVDAVRNKTSVTLPAPEGEPEARRMVNHLLGFGWVAQAFIRSTFNTDPRFHQLTKEKT